MEPIYPFSELIESPQTVKSAARNDLVRLTEQGFAAWVFMSEEVFERRLQEAVEEALYELRLDEVIAQGLKACERGEYVIGKEAALQYLEELRR